MKAQGKNFKERGDSIGKIPAACANRHRELTDASSAEGGAGLVRPQNSNQQVQNQQNQNQQNHKRQNQQGDAGSRTIEMQPDNDFSKTDVSFRRVWSLDNLLTSPSLNCFAPSIFKPGRISGAILLRSSSTEMASVTRLRSSQPSSLFLTMRVLVDDSLVKDSSAYKSIMVWCVLSGEYDACGDVF